AVKASLKSRSPMDSPAREKTGRSAVTAAPGRRRRLGVALRAKCRPGWTLPGEFYRDEPVYELDLERVWRSGWLFAGHTCEISQPGDYFTLELDTDPLIVV